MLGKASRRLAHCPIGQAAALAPVSVDLRRRAILVAIVVAEPDMDGKMYTVATLHSTAGRGRRAQGSVNATKRLKRGMARSEASPAAIDKRLRP